MGSIAVRAVIELGVETVMPPLSTRGGKLATDIQNHAEVAGYSKTPDGWFVPITALMDKVEAVVDYLHFEARYYKEFEVCGGFEILTEDGHSIGVSLGSTFPFAMELAETVFQLSHENKSCRAFIDNDLYLNLTLENENIRIVPGHMARHIPQDEYLIPAEELRQGMGSAKGEVERFVGEIEPLLTKFSDIPISSQLVRQMFGLAQVN